MRIAPHVEIPRRAGGFEERMMNARTPSLVIALAAGLWASAASAMILTYDVTVTSTNWIASSTRPFGVPAQPTFTGTLSVDNTSTDLAALVSFTMVTGTQTWTEARIDPSSVVINFDGLGQLRDNWFLAFLGAGGFLALASDDTMNLQDATSNFISCNNCVSFAPASVPEPATLALLGLGLAGLGFSRRCTH